MVAHIIKQEPNSESCLKRTFCYSQNQTQIQSINWNWNQGFLRLKVGYPPKVGQNQQRQNQQQHFIKYTMPHKVPKNWTLVSLSSNTKTWNHMKPLSLPNRQSQMLMCSHIFHCWDFCHKEKLNIQKCKTIVFLKSFLLQNLRITRFFN